MIPADAARNRRATVLLGCSGEAEAAGGYVHVLIGNHESMNMIGDLRYVSKEEYAAFADDDRIELLAERPGTRSAWHLYPIRVDVSRTPGGRARVYRALHDDGVGVQVHYIPVHLQPYYRARLGTRYGDLPHTEAAYLGLLSLPLFPGLAEADQDHVITSLRRALDGASG